MTCLPIRSIQDCVPGFELHVDIGDVPVFDKPLDQIRSLTRGLHFPLQLRASVHGGRRRYDDPDDVICRIPAVREPSTGLTRWHRALELNSKGHASLSFALACADAAPPSIASPVLPPGAKPSLSIACVTASSNHWGGAPASSAAGWPLVPTISRARPPFSAGLSTSGAENVAVFSVSCSMTIRIWAEPPSL